MKIVANIDFTDGQAREAFQTYARIFGGELSLMTYGQLPESGPESGGMPDAMADRIAHAWLQVGDQSLMGADAVIQGQCPAQGGTVTLHFDDPAETRRVFDALIEGGRQDMPLATTSWSPLFGGLTDRFGQQWMLNTFPAAAAASSPDLAQAA